jgi:hypothetical protein
MPVCEETDYSHNTKLYPLTQNALNDFPPDQKLLGCALTDPYHDNIHGELGGDTGDMGTTSTSPKDPIFWRFHKFIDNVSLQRFFPPVQTITTNATRGEAVLNVSLDTVPPRIVSQNPFRLDPFITSLPTITDKESGLFGMTGIPALSAEFSEPVIGVKPHPII